MEDGTGESAPERVLTAVETGTPSDVRSAASRLAEAPADDRRAAVGELQSLAADRPAQFEDVLSALEGFLTDEERSVRLRTAKLFVTVASEFAAVPNGDVYAQDARRQGPILNLFQLEMSVKQLYPDGSGSGPAMRTASRIR